MAFKNGINYILQPTINGLNVIWHLFGGAPAATTTENGTIVDPFLTDL